MELLLLLLFAVPLSSAETHSLKYFYTAVKGIRIPEFTVVGQVDEEQFVHYDSKGNEMIPKTEWMKKFVAGEPDYWNSFAQNLQATQEGFKLNMDIAMQQLNETAGVHIVQYMYGCELDDDGSSRGYAQFGYNGEDYFTLDLKAFTWTAANHKAQLIIHMLDSTPANTNDMKNYLENICINWLKKYVSYGRETLERRVPPEVYLFQKSSSSPESVCHATGFFPKRVMMLWEKDGEELEEDVEVRETLPNQDGSFQKRIILRVSPEDLQKNNYTCVIQHSSLEEDLRVELRVPDDGFPIGIIIGVVVGLLVVVLVVVGGVVVWKKKNSGFKPASSGSASEGGDSASNGTKPAVFGLEETRRGGADL